MAPVRRATTLARRAVRLEPRENVVVRRQKRRIATSSTGAGHLRGRRMISGMRMVRRQKLRAFAAQEGAADQCTRRTATKMGLREDSGVKVLAVDPALDSSGQAETISVATGEWIRSAVADQGFLRRMPVPLDGTTPLPATSK